MHFLLLCGAFYIPTHHHFFFFLPWARCKENHFRKRHSSWKNTPICKKHMNIPIAITGRLVEWYNDRKKVKSDQEIWKLQMHLVQVLVGKQEVNFRLATPESHFVLSVTNVSFCSPLYSGFELTSAHKDKYMYNLPPIFTFSPFASLPKF
jgi:hypothetical protein